MTDGNTTSSAGTTRPPGAPPAPGDPSLDAAVVIARLDAADAHGVLQALALPLVEAGQVTDDFPAALWEREQQYPTGLPTPVPTAIPHADPQYVRTSGLAVATLARPVAFGEMGGNGSTIDVQLVVMPLLPDAASHLVALQRLMALLRDEDAVADLLAAADDAELRSRIDGYLAGR